MTIYYYVRNLVIDYEPAITLIIILAGLFFILTPAQGERIDIGQGDIVYMNETVDISQAVAWPDYRIAWCAANNYNCEPPDQVINVTGNFHTFLIDPAIFRYGTYYRWDGEWHPAEYAVAFTVLPGNRSTISVNNTTSANITAPAKRIYYGPYHYLIARGDTPMVYTRLARSDRCNLWVFGDDTALFDIPMTGNDGLYTATLTSDQTFALGAGEYPGYVQCFGNNSMQDIFLDNMTLDTPYDDAKVPDVEILSWNMGNAKHQFDTLASTMPNFDDNLTAISVSVADPSITITGVEKDDIEHKLYISGMTTLDNNTVVTLKLDPENYVLPRDVALHTWQAFTNGSIDGPRTFTTAFVIDKEELYTGAHEIVVNASKKGIATSASFIFKVSNIYVMPTPTPMAVKKLFRDDFQEIPVKATPTEAPTTAVPAPTPTPIPAANQTPTIQPTANVTVNQTSAVPVATKTIPTIPLSAGIVVSAIAGLIVLRSRL